MTRTDEAINQVLNGRGFGNYFVVASIRRACGESLNAAVVSRWASARYARGRNQRLMALAFAMTQPEEMRP